MEPEFRAGLGQAPSGRFLCQGKDIWALAVPGAARERGAAVLRGEGRGGMLVLAR